MSAGRGGRRRPPWLIGLVLLFGVAMLVGAVSTYRDQRTGTPGTATVTDCEGGGKYQPAIRCTGTWRVGGESLLAGARPVIGSIQGAGYGDVGKTIDVRVHGTDHATKPSLGTPIMLGALGAPVVAFAVFALVGWWRDG